MLISRDAIIVGGGHNGLAAGIILARAGWDVLLLERNEELGGAVRTAEVTLPGFHHDLFAANLNLFAGSPFHAEYGDDLRLHGLEFVPSSKPFSSVFPKGGFIGVSTDLDETLGMINKYSEADAGAWKQLFKRFNEIAPHLFPLLGVPLPSARAAKALVTGSRALGKQWPFELARLVMQSPREFVEEHFETREVQALCAAWGMHLDFAPDVSGGALFPFLETFADSANGMVLGRGGARNMIDAMRSLFEAEGGEVRRSSPVDQIEVHDGRATGVVLNGERLTATRAVIANLTPPVLFGGLVPDAVVPTSFRNKVAAYKQGPGTMMVHLAMEDLPDWEAGPEAREYAYVHIGPYMEDMSVAYLAAQAGILPRQPMLVVGQPTAVDPSRAPAGKHVLWIQARVVPGRIKGDAAGTIEARDWDVAKEAYADRLVDIIESYAPGTRDRILGRHVLSPADLERANPNLVGGDSLGGSHHLMQHFFLRPFPGWTRYETPVENLFMCGAGTWPGAGVGAGSGYLLGKQLTATSPIQGIRDRIFG